MSPAAAFMLGLWVASSALAASADLHRWLHSESTTHTHSCALTLLSKGEVLVGPPVAWAPPVAQRIFDHLSERSEVFVPVFFDGLHTRGPPVPSVS